jgi:hypothetical protein
LPAAAALLEPLNLPAVSDSILDSDSDSATEVFEADFYDDIDDFDNMDDDGDDDDNVMEDSLLPSEEDGDDDDDDDENLHEEEDVVRGVGGGAAGWPNARVSILRGRGMVVVEAAAAAAVVVVGASRGASPPRITPMTKTRERTGTGPCCKVHQWWMQ